MNNGYKFSGPCAVAHRAQGLSRVGFFFSSWIQNKKEKRKKKVALVGQAHFVVVVG